MMSNAVGTALISLKESIETLEEHLKFIEYAYADTKKTYDITSTIDGFSQIESINREEFLEFVLENTLNVLFFEIDSLKIEVLNKLKKAGENDEPTNE